MKITFDAVTTIPAGVALRLTPAQVESRNHVLEPFENQKHVMVGTQPLQFKRGETVVIVGDLPKGILPIYDLMRAAESKSIPPTRGDEPQTADEK